MEVMVMRLKDMRHGRWGLCTLIHPRFGGD